MHTKLYNYFRNLLLPCVFLSALAGFVTAIIITAFKHLADLVIRCSYAIYGSVRENPAWLPLLILGAAALGLAVSFILTRSHSCRGGGIPNSVAAIRGIVSFKWVASIFLLPLSALMTFLCGIPLGTEGPCVQMGTAVGDGIMRYLGGEKNRGWRRYVMTGGASAGFSIATGAPLGAILFSAEELLKHFSPMVLTAASISVMTAQATSHILSLFGIGALSLFPDMPTVSALSPKLLFTPIIIGIAAGIAAIAFTQFYHLVDRAVHSLLKRVSKQIVFPILFASVAVVGFFFADALGTGHSLTETLFTTRSAWYVLLITFIIRTAVMMVSNTAGTSGGIFLPTIAFGAIIGSVCAEMMIALGWISDEHYLLMVVLGITAFLGATSRIPVTACVFAVEALGCINAVLPIIIATTVALLVTEASGLEDFTDTVIAAKLRSIIKGKEPVIIEVPLRVEADSFAVGKELRDILWPNSCSVVSRERSKENRGNPWIVAGDVITVHYKTYHPELTAEELEILVGPQTEEVHGIMVPHRDAQT